MEQQAWLILEDGTAFAGTAFGAVGECTGEVVFTTAMTGYLETLTDPSYLGQIVVQTFPLIGNYGVIPQDFESEAPQLRGYVVHEWCQAPSNFRQQGDLDDYLRQRGIIGLYGVDTRALTRRLRTRGVMNGRISLAPQLSPETLWELKGYRIVDAVGHACQDEMQHHRPDDEKRHVVLWDFGAKRGIVRALVQRGCRVTSVPSTATADEILALRPDGLMLSNGPGDPAENVEITRQLQKLCEAGLPIFGICLGHQLLALARGGGTEKLRYGHRGANQPVKDLACGRVYITSQNHGYAVAGDLLPQGGALRFANANDGTCEGLDYTDIPAFSVQFHPEACGGPRDTSFLFDRFVRLMDDR